MKYITIIYLVCLFYIQLAKSQVLPTNNLFNCLTDSGSCLMINTQYTSQSNSFSYPFIHHLLRNKYITKEIKDYNPYKKNILALYEWLNEIDYYIKPDSLFGTDNTGLHFSTKYQQLFTLSSQKDLIKMMLYGNKPFAGKEVKIDPSKFYYLNFYNFTFGIFKNYKHNTFLFKALFDVNFHLFKEIQYLNIHKGSIFTADDGTFIDLALKGTYQASNRYNPGLSFNMGLQWNHFNSQTTISFNVYQLGFCKLGNRSQFARIDTTIRFEGLEIQNILTQPTLQSGLLSNDSLINYYKTFIDTHTSYLRIPEIIRISANKKWKHRILTESSVGISYIYHTGQTIPETYFLQSIAIKPNLHISLGASLFGFSFINKLLFVSYRSSKKWEVNLYYSNPLSYIHKRYPYNNSIQVLFKKAF